MVANFAYVLLTNNETDRSSFLLNQLRDAVSGDLINVISTPMQHDHVSLAKKGLIDLFPSHWISDKLYSPSKRVYMPGTLGCQLNHHISCLELTKSRYDYFVVLEDNAELATDFHSTIVDILLRMAHVQCDIIHLFSNLTHPREKFIPGIRHGSNEWGTTKAHIISRRYAHAMASRTPFHEVSDGISMIPSLQWMGSGLSSFLADPLIAKKSTLLPPTRIVSDMKSAQSASDLIVLSDTGDSRLKRIESSCTASEIPYLSNYQETDLYLQRQMYLTEPLQHDEHVIIPVSRQYAKQLINTHDLPIPSFDRIIQPISEQDMVIHEDSGSRFVFDSALSTRLPHQDRNITIHWMPKDIRMPRNVFPCHPKSFPELGKKLRFAI